MSLDYNIIVTTIIVCGLVLLEIRNQSIFNLKIDIFISHTGIDILHYKQREISDSVIKCNKPYMTAIMAVSQSNAFILLQ